MKKIELPIPIHRLAYLQAYLYQVFTLDNNCKKNFDNTEWYLRDTHSDEEVKSAIDFFKRNGLKCDCDIINKFDLREITNGNIKPHH